MFASDGSDASITAYVEMFDRIISHYKYMEAPFEEALSKVLRFLKAFSEKDVHSLAKVSCFAGSFPGS